MDNTLITKGVVTATGNCMGGATSVYGGAFIQEDRDWFADRVAGNGIHDFYTQEQVYDAYEYVGNLVAPGPMQETPGTGTDTLIQE